MSNIDNRIDAGGATPPAEVKVWDPFVRLFHWSLVALFAGAYATGDELESVHVLLGYGIAGLIGLRLVWGFVGSRHARFSDFVRSPAAVLAYLRDVVALKARRYLGHNPAGGAMIVALLVSLAATCVSGYLMTDALWGKKWIEEVHEAFANLTLALVLAHVAGVLVSGFLHRENLVKAMLTGKKRAE